MADTNGYIEANGTAQPLPIVIAGGGCVGLFFALLLTQSQIPNRVIVIEPSTPDTSDTRAMAHQPLIFPLFAQAGLMPELSHLGSFASGICFRTSAKNGSKLIAGKQFNVPAGDKAQLLLPQWKFQDLLIQKVKESETGEIRLGSKLTGFEEKEGRVNIKVENEQGTEETIDAAYLIGADGAKSTVRKLLNISLEGDTLDAQLVATDIKYDFHAHGFYDANFVIDPEDYGLIGRIDSEGLWRVSYGVPNGISEDEINKDAEAKLRKMLPDEGKEWFEIKRVAPYKAQQRCAETFWKGRVGLCGDAAHLTNPYAGLGLASGIADATALSTVLVRILNNQASNASQLLSSWSQARRQKFLSVVDKPSRMAYARVKTKVDTNEEIQELLERDMMVAALKKGMPMMPPSLITNGEELEGW